MKIIERSIETIKIHYKYDENFAELIQRRDTAHFYFTWSIKKNFQSWGSQNLKIIERLFIFVGTQYQYCETIALGLINIGQY